MTRHDTTELGELIHDFIEPLGFPIVIFGTNSDLNFFTTEEPSWFYSLKALFRDIPNIRQLYLSDMLSKSQRVISTQKDLLGFTVVCFRFSDKHGKSCFISVIQSVSDIDAVKSRLDIHTDTSNRMEKKRISRVKSSIQEWENLHAENYVVDKIKHLSTRLDDELDTLSRKAFYERLSSYAGFVESFTHEAFGPIQQVKSSIELLLRGGLDEPVRSKLTSCDNALNKLRVALEGMRLLFEESAQVANNRMLKLDLLSICNDWSGVFAIEAQAKNINIYFEPKMDWIQKGVKEYIDVLVKNLLENAIKYSFDASSYDDKPGKIVITWEAFRRRLSFVNFGIPIPAEEINSGKLFDYQMRGRTSTDRGRSGRGVGLYTVKKIADMHSASIEVKSTCQNPNSMSKNFYRNEIAIVFPSKLAKSPLATRGTI